MLSKFWLPDQCNDFIPRHAKPHAANPHSGDNRQLRSLLLISALGMGLLAGSPMTPAEISELFSRMNQPKLAHTLRKEDEDQKYK